MAEKITHDMSENPSADNGNLDVGGLLGEISDLKARLVLLEANSKPENPSFMVDMLWGTVHQLQAQVQELSNQVDSGNPAPSMYNDEVGANVLPPADYEYQPYQRKKDVGGAAVYGFDYLRAH